MVIANKAFIAKKRSNNTTLCIKILKANLSKTIFFELLSLVFVTMLFLSPFFSDFFSIDRYAIIQACGIFLAFLVTIILISSLYTRSIVKTLEELSNGE